MLLLEAGMLLLLVGIGRVVFESRRASMRVGLRELLLRRAKGR